MIFGRLPPVTDPRKTIVVTGIGVVSPYGIGLDCLQAGVLSGKSCLLPTKNVYPGFEGTTAQVCGLPHPPNGTSSRYSRSDRLAMEAAGDAVANLGCESVGFRESGIGVFMASTVAGLSEIDPVSSRTLPPGIGGAVFLGLPPIRRRMLPTPWVSTWVIDGPRCAVSAACA